MGGSRVLGEADKNARRPRARDQGLRAAALAAHVEPRHRPRLRLPRGPHRGPARSRVPPGPVPQLRVHRRGVEAHLRTIEVPVTISQPPLRHPRSRRTSATAWGSQTPSSAPGCVRAQRCLAPQAVPGTSPAGEPVPRTTGDPSPASTRGEYPRTGLRLVDQRIVALDLARAGLLAAHLRRDPRHLLQQLEQARARLVSIPLAPSEDLAADRRACGRPRAGPRPGPRRRRSRASA